MKTPERKECPKCKENNSVTMHIHRDGKIYVFAKCVDCGYCAPAVAFPNNPANFKAREEIATAVWNIRVTRR